MKKKHIKKHIKNNSMHLFVLVGVLLIGLLVISSLNSFNETFTGGATRRLSTYPTTTQPKMLYTGTLPAPTPKIETYSKTKPTFGPAQPTGIVIGKPRTTSAGMTISYDIQIGGDVTSGLSSKSTQLRVANQISSTVSQGYSIATDGLKALLGIPGIPSAVDILSWMVSWLDQNAPPCLRQIGEKYNGKTFKGTYIYEVKKGKGSSIYKNWDYFYLTETFRGNDGFVCTQGPTCTFSAEKVVEKGVMKGYSGKTGRC